MRLDRFVCKSTELDRKHAQNAIKAGLVQVNEQLTTKPSTQVHETNLIKLRGQRLIPRASRYLLLNKPKNCVCSNVDEHWPSIFTLFDIEHSEELHIAGRLDADTTGLVLASDDGRWSFNVMRPIKKCVKVYRVSLNKPISASAIEQFKHGIQLQGENTLTSPAKLELISNNEALLSIYEGKYHQVKRMFKAIGNRVNELHREQIGGICLDVGLQQWRNLNDEEVALFFTESELD